MADPKITQLELVVFEYQVQDLGTDYNGFNQVYEKGRVMTVRAAVLRLHTDTGVIGDYLTGGRAAHQLGSVSGYLIGKNPFQREKIYGGGPAHRHCIAAIRNTNYYEFGLLNPKVKRTKPPVYPPEFTDELENIDENGRVPVPQSPGLGVEMDWDYIRAHQVDTVVYE